jgi:hypothetical protein
MKYSTPHKPSLEELKRVIKNHKDFHYIAKNKVLNMCDHLAGEYQEELERKNIDFVHLSPVNGFMGFPDHMFLAVDTSDCGIVIFDPSFKQFYPEYTDKYFLGSPQRMYDCIMADAGKDGLSKIITREPFYLGEHGDEALRVPDITVESGFMNLSIESSLFPRPVGSPEANNYLRQYANALKMFSPKRIEFREPWGLMTREEKTAHSMRDRSLDPAPIHVATLWEDSPAPVGSYPHTSKIDTPDLSHDGKLVASAPAPQRRSPA